MALVIPSADIEAVLRGLIGAIDVDGGPTPSQLAVLDSISRHLWNRDLAGIQAKGPLSAAATAAAITDPLVRRRFHEVLVALEVCRHPLSEAQVNLIDDYALALDFSGPDLEIFRDLVRTGAEQAAADFRRFLQDNLAQRSEPALAELPVLDDRPEPELAARYQAFAEMPADSLGASFLAFYRRNGIAVPGTEASSMNHFFAAHDMTHVIAGIEPTGPGEVALSAFQMAMDDNPVNCSALLASLVVHEAGLERSPSAQAECGVLGLPGAAELLGQEMARGASCIADFSLVDHFDLAPLSLAEVRDQFGVLPPLDPDDGHHCW